MRLRFQKGDAVLIGGVILVAVLVLLCFLPSETAAYAEIYQNGTFLRRAALSDDQVFTLTGDYTNTVTVCDGRIAITASDCPGGDCVSCGWMSASGRSIVCLPNGVEIRVVGDRGEVDMVVG